MIDAIVALGMGGPDSADAVRPFLKNLLSDREIIDFGVGDSLQNFIASRIASKRSKAVIPSYNKMGGGSPQYPLTKGLIEKVAVAYTAKTGRDADAYVGMCYWHPFIEDVFSEIYKKNYDKVILVPMYPQYSRTTSGACLGRVNRFLQRSPLNGQLNTIFRFNTDQRYINLVADRIGNAAKSLNKDIADVHVLFSAHSLPQSVVDAGDPYVLHLQEEINMVTNLIKPASYSVGYQSKIGRMKWLSPAVKDELITLSKKGVKDIVIHAISFVNDHIETLIELDEEIIPFGESLGMNVVRTKSFNTDDDFANALAEILIL